MSFGLRLLLVASVLLGATSCILPGGDSDASWSQAERENAVHLIQAIQFAQEGIQISNRGGPGTISESDLEGILEAWRLALSESALADDQMLAKVDPELPEHFRDEFEAGLRLRVQNLEGGDVQAEMRGSQLMEAWADWYIPNSRDWRIPRP